MGRRKLGGFLIQVRETARVVGVVVGRRDVADGEGGVRIPHERADLSDAGVHVVDRGAALR